MMYFMLCLNSLVEAVKQSKFSLSCAVMVNITELLRLLLSNIVMFSFFVAHKFTGSDPSLTLRVKLAIAVISAPSYIQAIQNSCHL